MAKMRSHLLDALPKTGSAEPKKETKPQDPDAIFGKPFKGGDMTVQEANEKLYHEVESLMLENLDEDKKIKKHA